MGSTGRVFAFEPSPIAQASLKEMIRENKITNIDLCCAAVGNVEGEVDILLPSELYPVQDFKKFDSYGSYGLDPKADEGRKVDTMTIDSLNIQEPISFMKVDVQGSDLFVLEGARETMKRHKMPILFEYEEQFNELFQTTWKDYTDFIESVSYKIAMTIYNINYLIVPK